jgi:hypothetical protein
VFEIADSEDAPALASLDASVEPGRQATWRMASGVVPARALPPGRYVTRAKIARNGKAVGVLVRPFVLEPEGGADAVPGGAVAVAPSVAIRTRPASGSSRSARILACQSPTLWRQTRACVSASRNRPSTF